MLMVATKEPLIEAEVAEEVEEEVEEEVVEEARTERFWYRKLCPNSYATLRMKLA